MIAEPCSTEHTIGLNKVRLKMISLSVVLIIILVVALICQLLGRRFTSGFLLLGAIVLLYYSSVVANVTILSGTFELIDKPTPQAKPTTSEDSSTVFTAK